ncbi:MAG: iron-sulfur cluster assembly accessory protein [archaeon GW2011_AR17]|nr:MAG: iron-sulfur cluster assembly accessory protein [archaeon GW2011_AR17]MBS3154280.1 iron-sulfur cluster assembly accessory protein [Candidatus Woesearchaeota archaeon]
MEESQTLHKITSDMTIGEVVKLYPQCIEIMLSYGLHCVGCGSNTMETLYEGSAGHGMPDDIFQEMLEHLNDAIIEIEGKTLTITAKASEKILELLKKNTKESYGLRIQVIKGGCAGKEYKFSFEEEPKEGDEVIVAGDVKVFVDAESGHYLKGSLVDYLESLEESGFRVSNPNSSHSCGCGKSFT